MLAFHTAHLHTRGRWDDCQGDRVPAPAALLAARMGPAGWASATPLHLGLYCSPGASLTTGPFSTHRFSMFSKGHEVSLPTLFPTQVSPVDLRQLSKDSPSGPISGSLGTSFCGSRRPATWAMVGPLVSRRGYPSSTYHIILMGTSPLRSQKSTERTN